MESDIYFLYYNMYKIVRHVVHFYIFHVQYGTRVKIT